VQLLSGTALAGALQASAVKVSHDFAATVDQFSSTLRFGSRCGQPTQRTRELPPSVARQPSSSCSEDVRGMPERKERQPRPSTKVAVVSMPVPSGAVEEEERWSLSLQRVVGTASPPVLETAARYHSTLRSSRSPLPLKVIKQPPPSWAGTKPSLVFATAGAAAIHPAAVQNTALRVSPDAQAGGLLRRHQRQRHSQPRSIHPRPHHGSAVPDDALLVAAATRSHKPWYDVCKLWSPHRGTGRAPGGAGASPPAAIVRGKAPVPVASQASTGASSRAVLRAMSLSQYLEPT
jgi:hypothetical protein